tara:strand:+ start:508 stop:729 length:222 start_codon:yes stop_codon:yes gene_type:complete
MFDLKLEPASDASKLVDADLNRRLTQRKEAGVVDMKAMCSPDRNSSAKDKRWALNNVLRRREAGLGKTDIISK